LLLYVGHQQSNKANISAKVCAIPVCLARVLLFRCICAYRDRMPMSSYAESNPTQSHPTHGEPNVSWPTL